MKYTLPIFLSTTFFLTGLLTISDYGMNWDSPIHMLRGQAYAHLFLTGKDTYGYQPLTSPIFIKPHEYVTRYNFLAGEEPGKRAEVSDRPLLQRKFKQTYQGKRVSFYQHEVWNGRYFMNSDSAHLPLADILRAFFNRFFYQYLGILEDIESYQLFNILISAMGIFLVTLFTFEITRSKVASFIAGLSLALFPIYFAESHFNMNDPSQAAFFTGAVWSFWHWLKSNRIRWFFGFAVFVALALGIKWNIIFLPLIVIPWLFFIRKTEEFKAWFKFGRLGILGGLGILGVFLFLVLIWPYAWADPIGRMLEVFSYYLNVGVGTSYLHREGEGLISPLGFNLFPMVLLFTRTPEIILILSATGLIWSLKGHQDHLKSNLLITLWVIVSILRQSFPNVMFYSGIRQIMEVLPALAILSGLGAYYLIQNAKLKVQSYVKSGIVVFFILMVIKLIQLHPNQNAYFNSLVGGVKGGYQNNLISWAVSYGNIFKQAALWLNENALKNADIALISGRTFALSPLWLRDDISISPDHFSGFEKRGEYILILTDDVELPIFAHGYPRRFLKPIHQLEVDGVPLLTIYKNDAQFINSGFEKEAHIKGDQLKVDQDEDSGLIEIDLGRKLAVTRIVVNKVPPYCQVKNYRFINQFFSFDSVTYGLSEKINLGEGRIEYDFLAEPTKVIRIRPQSIFSCFNRAEIESVAFIE